MCLGVTPAVTQSSKHLPSSAFHNIALEAGKWHRESFHLGNQQPLQIRAVLLQGWLLHIEERSACPPGPWRAHPQQKDAKPLLPSGICFHPQTSRTYFRTTKESPELIGPIVPPPADGLRLPLSTAPPHCSEAPPRPELGGASRSEPWTVALCLL